MTLLYNNAILGLKLSSLNSNLIKQNKLTIFSQTELNQFLDNT